VGRDLKEAVAGAVSESNQCPYCVDVHTAMVQATTGHDAAAAIRSGQLDGIADERMAQLVRWAAATRSPAAASLASPPFSDDEAPEIIGTALVYHYVNRMVHVFLDTTPLPITRPGRDLARRVFGATFARRMVRRNAEPGASLGFLSFPPPSYRRNSPGPRRTKKSRLHSPGSSRLRTKQAGGPWDLPH